MTDDKDKFEDISTYKGGYVKFYNDNPCFVKGNGTIQLTNKITCDNFYWV